MIKSPPPSSESFSVDLPTFKIWQILIVQNTCTTPDSLPSSWLSLNTSATMSATPAFLPLRQTGSKTQHLRQALFFYTRRMSI